jgi:hypothetical protein
VLAGGQSVDLGLLLADHVEEAVLLSSVGTFLQDVWVLATHHLPLLFVLQLLMQLAQAGCALMVWAVRERPSTTSRRAPLHLAGRWDTWVVEVEVHADAGPATGPFDVSPHATGGRPALIFVLDACVHCGGGCEGVR